MLKNGPTSSFFVNWNSVCHSPMEEWSSLKILKTSRRMNMQSDTLNDLLEIYVEGSPLSSFCPDKAIELWWHDCTTSRRPISNLERTTNHETKSHLTPVMLSPLTLRIHHLLCGMIGLLILKLNNLINYWTHFISEVHYCLRNTMFVKFDSLSQ